MTNHENTPRNGVYDFETDSEIKRVKTNVTPLPVGEVREIRRNLLKGKPVQLPSDTPGGNSA